MTRDSALKNGTVILGHMTNVCNGKIPFATCLRMDGKHGGEVMSL